MARIQPAVLVIMLCMVLKESCWASGSFKVKRNLRSNNHRVDIFRAKRSVSCVDSYSSSTCSTWKSRGWCYQYRYYCRKTCDPLCQGENFSYCRNKYAQTSCETWVISGYCPRSSKYAAWMKTNCPNSCGYCRCKNNNKYCSNWARKGECKKNPRYMLINCQLSCGVCRPKITRKPITKPRPKPTPKPTKKPTKRVATKATTKATTNPTTVTRRTCGISTTGSRIVGGKFALPGEWPWHAAITHCLNCSKLPFCGGTLISNEWVVTAAHCMTGWQASKLFVILGETNFLQQNRHEVVRKVRAIYSHHDYAIAARFDYDVALLRLGSSVKFTHYIQPACLPKLQPKLPAGMNCTVTGFGRTSERGLKSPRLQQATVPLISNFECKKVVGTTGSLRITPTMLCAGHVKGGIDACQGDSGGPLVCKSDDGSYELAGVVSWGKGCARAKQYGVYADMQALRGWVENVISGKTPKRST